MENLLKEVNVEELYEKCIRREKSFLFETNNKAYLGCDPDMEIVGYLDRVIIRKKGKKKIIVCDGLEYLDEFISGLGSEDLAVGGFSYEFLSGIKSKLYPGYVFYVYSSYILIKDKKIETFPERYKHNEKKENISKFKSKICSLGDEDRFKENIKSIQKKLDDKTKQIVISDRHTYEYSGDEFEIYKNLKLRNKSPYNYFFDFEEFKLLGTSPEMLVKIDDNKIFTCPIAGTRPISRDVNKNKEYILSLVTDEKELKEHEMLVELAFQDMNKVSKDVEKIKDKQVHAFSHVMHMVTELCGDLNENILFSQIIKIFFPAGTVSGSPRAEAIKTIRELEKEERGFFAGAVGIIDNSLNMDFAITIRSIFFKENFLYTQAGAGIVADSKIDMEYAEILNKMKAMDDVLRGL